MRLSQVSNNIPLTSDNLPVVFGFFDSYRNNSVAPDHLLSNVSKNVLNVCFRVLPTNEDRIKIDRVVCSYLGSNGLPKERSIYNIRKKKLHSMSMS